MDSMNIPTPAPVPETTGLEALATYLGESPQAVQEGPENLAKSFDVPVQLVRDMLSHVDFKSGVSAPSGHKNLWSQVKQVKFSCTRFAVRATRRPLRYFALVGVAALFITALLQLGFQTKAPALVARVAPDIGVLSCWLILGGFYGFCLFWRPRYPILIMALTAYALVFACIDVIAEVLSQIAQPSRGNNFFSLSDIDNDIGAVFFAFIFLLGCLAAGNYYQSFRKAKRHRRRSSQLRQELLHRLLHIQAALKVTPGTHPAAPLPLLERWLPVLRQHTWSVAALAGLCYYVALNVTVWSGHWLSAFMWCCIFLMSVVLGIIAGHPLRALPVAALANIMLFLPGPVFFNVVRVGSLPELIFGLVLWASPLALIGGAIGFTESRRSQTRRRARGDTAELMAEMVEIRWNLAMGARDICVLVVDVAGSTSMKVNTDPILAEMSFRSYQQLVAAVCAEFGGKVHSKSGDGTIVAFEDCENAMQAARALHVGIERFNHSTNRLASPFRLRIGLHVGEVAGTLDDVVFTRVIDVAAHVEGSAPIGGIALTEPVAERLLQSKLKEAPALIDGYRILVEHAVPA